MKEEFQHTAYATNAYVTIGPLAKQVTQGKKIVKVEVCSSPKNNHGAMKSSKRSRSSGLEFKLDELRKEFSSSHGGIFPHSVLSTCQIRILGAQKPMLMEELEKIIGKLKTQKYGSRILEEIVNYESKHHCDNDIVDEGQVSGSGASEMLRSKKALIVIDSSGDEE
ncbi:unnamed protein product [Ilex paraguariensis]|uniref:HRDC domain-containing protein n=1 Tax=Ilex paraguariensis TaxID=185542 RepID=A0ABC8STD2_9AQUA